MADFKIEVPINVKGVGEAKAGAGGDAVKKELEKLNKNTLKLNKTMFLNIDVIEILSSVVHDLFKVIQPLFKLLGIMLVLVFLPLLPLFKDLISALGWLTKKIVSVVVSPEKFVEEKGRGVAAIVAGILIAVGAVILFALGGWILALLGTIAAIIIVFWDDIAAFFMNAWNNYLLPAFRWIGDQIMIVGGLIADAWDWFTNIPTWIWETMIRPSWEFLKDVGHWIWDIIGAPFRWLADKIMGIGSWFSGIGGKVKGFLGFEKGGMVPGPIGSPQIAVVHGGETIIPAGRSGGSIIININNPSVRQTSDIKMMASEISRVLQRQMSGRISQ